MQALGAVRVVGVSESPDNVAFPLAVPRVYVSRRTTEARFGHEADPEVNTAKLWVRDPGRLDEVLVQARATSYGIHGLRFVTRAGVKILLDEAAGIVIALLVALSVIALLTASVMLASSARAEVQRRLAGLGLRRALGATRAHVTLAQAARGSDRRRARGRRRRARRGVARPGPHRPPARGAQRGPTGRRPDPAARRLFRIDNGDPVGCLRLARVAIWLTPADRPDVGTRAPGKRRQGRAGAPALRARVARSAWAHDL